MYHHVTPVAFCLKINYYITSSWLPFSLHSPCPTLNLKLPYPIITKWVKHLFFWTLLSQRWTDHIVFVSKLSINTSHPYIFASISLEPASKVLEPDFCYISSWLMQLPLCQPSQPYFQLSLACTKLRFSSFIFTLIILIVRDLRWLPIKLYKILLNTKYY